MCLILLLILLHKDLICYIISRTKNQQPLLFLKKTPFTSICPDTREQKLFIDINTLEKIQWFLKLAFYLIEIGRPLHFWQKIGLEICKLFKTFFYKYFFSFFFFNIFATFYFTTSPAKCVFYTVILPQLIMTLLLYTGIDKFFKQIWDVKAQKQIQ